MDPTPSSMALSRLSRCSRVLRSPRAQNTFAVDQGRERQLAHAKGDSEAGGEDIGQGAESTGLHERLVLSAFAIAREHDLDRIRFVASEGK